MEIAPSGRFAYIANRELGVLSIFDTTRNAVTGTIKVAEGGPQFVSFAPDGKRAYVSIFNNARTVNVVGVLDTATNAFIATIPVGVRPFALDVTPDGKKVYVPNHDSGSITVIDTATNNVINTIKVAPNPHWVDVSADGKTLYAANHESNVVSMIDTTNDKVITTVPVGQVTAQHPAPPHEAVAVQRELRQQLAERDRHQLEQGHQDRPDGQPPAGHHAVRRRRAHLHRRGRRQRDPGVQHEDHGHRVAGAGGQGARRASR